MNKLTNGSSFPSAVMDVRQVPARRNPNSKMNAFSGITNEWFGGFKSGSSLIPKLFTDKAAVAGMLSVNRTRVARSGFSTNREYELARWNVTSLLYIEEDEDFVRPTQYALDLTLSLLEDANAELITRGAQFPRGTSSTSDKGGIYVFWEMNSRSVQLEVPYQKGGMFYIHVISPDGSFMDKDVSAKRIADALAVANPSGSRKLGTKNVPASSAAR